MERHLGTWHGAADQQAPAWFRSDEPHKMGLQPTPAALFKTTMCKSISQGVACRFGDRCNFAHSEVELRVSPRVSGAGLDKTHGAAGADDVHSSTAWDHYYGTQAGSQVNEHQAAWDAFYAGHPQQQQRSSHAAEPLAAAWAAYYAQLQVPVVPALAWGSSSQQAVSPATQPAQTPAPAPAPLPPTACFGPTLTPSSATVPPPHAWRSSPPGLPAPTITPGLAWAQPPTAVPAWTPPQQPPAPGTAHSGFPPPEGGFVRRDWPPLSELRCGAPIASAEALPDMLRHDVLLPNAALCAKVLGAAGEHHHAICSRTLVSLFVVDHLPPPGEAVESRLVVIVGPAAQVAHATAEVIHAVYHTRHGASEAAVPFPGGNYAVPLAGATSRPPGGGLTTGDTASMLQPLKREVPAAELFRKPTRDARPERVVILLRGLPGSGKTRAAKLLRAEEATHCGSSLSQTRLISLDDLFLTEGAGGDMECARAFMRPAPAACSPTWLVFRQIRL